ncbi:hypothetical protein EF847_15220 [Actinobacteria bacterium YIM 96077]|uniref:Uncharacterized protein n=1 Tax=Phytoactinopolyspora halophila TaxID=1981511 RepID=A0A329QY91_9ACTN|nr:hypothetical protein EF847_15220 [Actinobacteria bacterium YIM 96077]RAW15608.1 hypothetical protein DPM12_08120 [Phytoactinopolyspora halophila]
MNHHLRIRTRAASGIEDAFSRHAGAPSFRTSALGVTQGTVSHSSIGASFVVIEERVKVESP